MASNREKCKSLSANQSNIAEPKRRGTSSLMISRSTFRVLTDIAEIPSTRSMLVMLEPMTLPTTISEEPLKTDRIDVVSSGSDVPKDTSVTPITKGLIPHDRPIPSALSINLLEAIIRADKLATKMRRVTTTYCF